MDQESSQSYTIYDLGYSRSLERNGASAGLAPATTSSILGTSTTGLFQGGLTNLIEGVSEAQGINSGQLTGQLEQVAGVLYSGKTSFTDTTAGYRFGIDESDNTYKFIMGTTGSSIDWNVTTANTLTITGTVVATGGSLGGFNIGSDYIRDVANSFGLASTVTGGDDVRFWAGATFASRASAPLRIYESGLIVATGATINGSAITNNDVFGNGADGDLTISSNTSLTRDTFLNDLTIDAGFTLTTAGFRLFVKGTLTIASTGVIGFNGVNGNNGNNGSGTSFGTGGAGGASLADGNLKGSEAGKNGTSGGAGGNGGSGNPGSNGTNGTAITNSFADSYSQAGSTGGAGGTGGTGGGTGGTPGTSGTISASFVRPYSSIFGVPMLDFTPGSSPAFLRYNGNAGGSTGGGGGGSNVVGTTGGGGGGGGGNGSAGGTVVIAAKTIVNNGSIQAVGGNGGNGGNGANAAGAGVAGGGGGGAGGNGGAGGVIVLIYQSLSGSGTITAAGGAVGTGGTGGTQVNGGGNGANGGTPSAAPAGVIIQLPV
jgi:hypothetical protein